MSAYLQVSFDEHNFNDRVLCFDEFEAWLSPTFCYDHAIVIFQIWLAERNASREKKLEAKKQARRPSRVPGKKGTVVIKLWYELYIRASYFISFNKYINTQVIILLQLSH